MFIVFAANLIWNPEIRSGATFFTFKCHHLLIRPIIDITWGKPYNSRKQVEFVQTNMLKTILQDRGCSTDEQGPRETLDGARACPICLSTDLHDHLVVRSNVPPFREFSIIGCMQCDHKMLFPSPTSEELEHFYGDEYPAYQLHIANTFRSRVRRLFLRNIYGKPFFGAILWRMFEWLLPNYPQYVDNGRALDIGCGAGSILLELKELGWRCSGIDMEQSVADNLAKYDIEVTVGDALDSLRAIPGASYDAVLCSHFLEHIADPVPIVKEIGRIIRPGGELVITLPNMSSWIAKREGAKWRGIECPGHLHFFSRQSLARMLSESGFAIRNIRCSQVEQSWLTAYPAEGFLRRFPVLLNAYATLLTQLLNLLKTGDVMVARARKAESVGQDERNEPT